LAEVDSAPMGGGKSLGQVLVESLIKEPNLGRDPPGKIDIGDWPDRVRLDEEIVRAADRRSSIEASLPIVLRMG